MSDRVKRQYPDLVVVCNRQRLIEELAAGRDPVARLARRRQLTDYIDRRLAESGDRRLEWIHTAARWFGTEDPVYTLYENREYLRSLERIPRDFQVLLDHGAVELSGNPDRPYVWRLRGGMIASFASRGARTLAAVCKLLCWPDGRAVSYAAAKGNPRIDLPIQIEADLQKA